MTGPWFSPSTPVSSTSKTDRHDITESGIKHHNPNPTLHIDILLLCIIINETNFILVFVGIVPISLLQYDPNIKVYLT